MKRPQNIVVLVAPALAWAVLTAIASGCEGDRKITPGRAQAGQVGAACQGDSDCTANDGLTCLKVGQDGYCSKDCSLLGQFDCPAESICEKLGDTARMCIDGCCSAEDCRDGYRCARRPELDIFIEQTGCAEPGVCLPNCQSNSACPQGYKCDFGSGQCVPKVGSGNGVGSACKGPSDCNSGTCLTTYPDGYCTSPCGTQLTGCEPGSECFAMDGSAPTCMLRCQQDGECRNGYRCETVAQKEGSGPVRGFCVPRCEAHTVCGDGTHCDAPSGKCVAGAAAPGPVGAFCSGNAECATGTCETSWPNGYCTSGCDACEPPGTCADARCVLGCTDSTACRYGYACLNGACAPRCTSDAACAAGQVCDTMSGACVKPAADTQRSSFGGGSITVSTSGSDELTFTVPAGALSAIITTRDTDSARVSIRKLTGPAGQLFDIENPAGAQVFFLPSGDGFTGMLPQGPSPDLVPGMYTVSFVRDTGSGPATVEVFGKVADGFPQKQQLGMSFVFVGAPEGLTAQSAQTDAQFQQAVQQMRAIYTALGLETGNVTYRDITGEAADRLRVIDSTEGPNNELGQVFALSKEEGQGVTFFFVSEILDGDDGFTILGVAGGIPGPPTIHGTPHSGVAVTLSGFRQDPAVLGQTMAHEGAHFLGLFHTTEATGTSHDPLPDTPECAAAADTNWDGYVDSGECTSQDATNFMFWLAGKDANATSPEQGRVLRRNPATR